MTVGTKVLVIQVPIYFFFFFFFIVIVVSTGWLWVLPVSETITGLKVSPAEYIRRHSYPVLHVTECWIDLYLWSPVNE